MRNYLIRSNILLQNLWPKYTWSIKNSSKIYLTFDDGPHPTITLEVIKLLEAYNAKATFFCIGKNVVQNPEIYKVLIAKGHAIGNHTYDHKNGWYTENKIYLKNVLKANEIINSNLFRPPYGRIKNKQANFLIKRGYRIIMWSLLSGDFDINIDGATCYNNIISNLKPGDIIVFHDSEKAYERMIYALPRLLEYCKENNIEMSTLPL